MKKTAFFVLCAVAAFSMSIILGLTGCEQESNDAIDFLTLEPSTATVGTNIVWFPITVVGGTRELSLPLQWSVQDGSKGTIREPANGFTAIYQRFPANGMNTVVVRDQYGAEGYCYINQVDRSTDDPSDADTDPGSTTTTTTTSTSTTTTTPLLVL